MCMVLKRNIDMQCVKIPFMLFDFHSHKKKKTIGLVKHHVCHEPFS